MKSSKFQVRISIGAMAAALLSAPLAALAQAAPQGAAGQSDVNAEIAAPDQTGNPAVEDIIITGSRIAGGFTAPTPLTVLDTTSIKSQAPTSISEVLTRLPQIASVQSSTSLGVSINNVGAATADLRSLGANRTLVLVDGKRFVSATVPSSIGSSGAVDLSLIPTMLVKRAEIVTGGASAAYGSDAVSGVVNLALDRSLQGIRFQTQYGFTNYGDNKEIQVAGAAGSGFAGDRGHIVVAAEYSKNDGVPNCYETTRRWCQPDKTVLPIVNPTPGLNGQPAQILMQDSRLAVGTRNGMISRGPLAGTAFDQLGNPIPFTTGFYLGSGVTMSGGSNEPHALSESIPMAAQTERYSVYGSMRYDISDRISATLDLSYGHNEGTANSTNIRYFSATNNALIRTDHAYLTPQTRALMASRGVTSFTLGIVPNALGSAVATTKRDTFRGALELGGQIGSGDWRWRTYYQYGQTDYALRVANSLITANFNKALDAVVGTGGQIICRSTLTSPSDGCVPINPFGNQGASAAAKAYSFGVMANDTRLVQHVISADVQGTLLDLPNGPIKLATGVEYRKETVSGSVDALSAQNQFNSVSTSAANGSVNVKEIFAEISAPIVKDVPLFKDLSVNLAGRLTDYSVSGQVVTWKAGLVNDVTGWLRLRATMSRDIRSPNVFDLFTTQFVTNVSIVDPVKRTSGIFSQVLGGNTNLTEEVARTFTAGVVLSPPGDSALKGVRLSFDYFNINLSNAIDTPGAQNSVTNCANGSTEACARVTRNAAGDITSIQNTLYNLNRLEVRGFDIEFAYAMPLQSFTKIPGNLNFRVLATHQSKLTTVSIDGSRINRAGQNEPGGIPSWRLNATVDYQNERFRLGARLRHVSAGLINAALIGPAQAGYNPSLPNSVNINDVPSRTYFDLNGSYEVTRLGKEGGLEVYFNINNVFEVDPPEYAGLQFGRGNPLAYDTLGRTARVGMRVRF